MHFVKTSEFATLFESGRKCALIFVSILRGLENSEGW